MKPNDWDYGPGVMLNLRCNFCGFEWAIQGRRNSWQVECPDCDHLSLAADLVFDIDCEGEISPLWFYSSFTSEPRVWGPVPYWPGLWV